MQDKTRGLNIIKVMKEPKWNDEKITVLLQEVISDIGHFPTPTELKSINKKFLTSVIYHHGGFIKFRKQMGYQLLKKCNNYWNDETTISELKLVINKLNHFPTMKELTLLKKYDLIYGVSQNGGFSKFRELMEYKLFKKPTKWNDKKIINELEVIIKEIGHFPTQKKLGEMNREDLCVAIGRHGGIIKFRTLLGYDLNSKPNGYWTDETIIKELKEIIDKIGYFPTWEELISLGRNDLASTITRNGGTSKFRELVGYKVLKNHNGYWTDEIIIEKLKEIINKIGHFPTSNELKLIEENSLIVMIAKNGGTNKFRELLGYTISMYDKYISELHLYSTKRGKKSEMIIKKILIDYCFIHNISPPQLNTKLARGNVLEFICNTDKKIGIDVTNTETKSVVSRKWTRKFYHLHLDELWIVVFSTFEDSDYIKWNNESPTNIKIMSVYTFLKELDYSISEDIKNKIDKYNSCTFHTKEKLLSDNVKIGDLNASNTIKYGNPSSMQSMSPI